MQVLPMQMTLTMLAGGLRLHLFLWSLQLLLELRQLLSLCTEMGHGEREQWPSSSQQDTKIRQRVGSSVGGLGPTSSQGALDEKVCAQQGFKLGSQRRKPEEGGSESRQTLL